MDKKQIIEEMKRLRKECIETLESYGQSLTAQIVVARVRDYNRKWNKLVEENPDLNLKQDGFLQLMKKQLALVEDASLQAAIQYL